MSTKEANNLLTRAKTWVTSISTEKQEMFLKLFILTSAAILAFATRLFFSIEI